MQQTQTNIQNYIFAKQKNIIFQRKKLQQSLENKTKMIQNTQNNTQQVLSSIKKHNS